jgi:hypothetical protein
MRRSAGPAGAEEDPSTSRAPPGDAGALRKEGHARCSPARARCAGRPGMRLWVWERTKDKGGIDGRPPPPANPGWLNCLFRSFSQASLAEPVPDPAHAITTVASAYIRPAYNPPHCPTFHSGRRPRPLRVTCTALAPGAPPNASTTASSSAPAGACARRSASASFARRKRAWSGPARAERTRDCRAGRAHRWGARAPRPRA